MSELKRENEGGGSEEGQKKGDCLRNICIMAHVDHGKTTLADALIATNGIISENQAGTMRYMDSRPDEMERGITMKSSCITLAHLYNEKKYLINLVDSPGHVDFSSEVSTAVRLCDGCLLVVDVVEGVCAQTKAVMRQAWITGVKPALILNKIDRLIIEKKMTSVDAYYHIINVLEQVNAYMAELYNMDVLGRTNIAAADRALANLSLNKKDISSAVDHGLEDIDDTDLYFNPTDGNVVFASAIDGWGFSISDFASQLSEKLGFSCQVLTDTLWGDYYIGGKGKERKIMPGARDKRKTPLFVSLILDNIYQLYNKVRPSTSDTDEIKRIAQILSIQVPSRLFQTNSEYKARFSYIIGNWLPLSKAVIGMVISKLPPPTQISEEKARKLLTTATSDFNSLPPQTKSLVSDLRNCSSDEKAPLVVYVSKMFGVSREKLQEADNKLAISMGARPEKPQPRIEATRQNYDENSDLPEIELEEETTEEEELLAFARIFSGSLKPGDEVYVLGPKHSPSNVLSLSPTGDLSEEDINLLPFVSKCTIKGVYLLMGREVQSLKTAPSGLMVGIRGLTGLIIKSGSLSSTPMCPPFTHVINSSALALGTGMSSSSDSAILRVQVLPRDPQCLDKLRHGLNLLNQADPCVQVWLESSGEYMVGVAGEVHLQRCVSDLQDRYACTPIKVSEPIVPFRETIVPPPSVDNVNEALEGENLMPKEKETDGCIEVDVGMGKMKVRAVPLPSEVTKLLLKHSDLLQLALSSNKSISSTSSSLSTSHAKDPFNLHHVDITLVKQTLSDDDKLALSELRKALESAFEDAGEEWTGVIDEMWCVGPQYSGPNVLINRVKEYKRPSMWELTATLPDCPFEKFDNDLVTGFQLFTSQGTLCEEPIMGVAFVIEDWTPPTGTESALPPGKAIVLSKELFQSAFDIQPRRMMVSMYSCTVTVSDEAVGSVYTVLGRRHGRVLHGDITEGSTSWNITAHLPIVESMNFANELRKMTSGEAQPQLIFSHWETLDIDPLWEPTSTEELKHFGEKADSANLGLHYMNLVRKRKGIKEHGKKVVELGEKQRTLTKNK